MLFGLLDEVLPHPEFICNNCFLFSLYNSKIVQGNVILVSNVLLWTGFTFAKAIVLCNLSAIIIIYI